MSLTKLIDHNQLEQVTATTSLCLPVIWSRYLVDVWGVLLGELCPPLVTPSTIILTDLHQGSDVCGPYKTNGEALKRVRQIEFFRKQARSNSHGLLL